MFHNRGGVPRAPAALKSVAFNRVAGRAGGILVRYGWRRQVVGEPVTGEQNVNLEDTIGYRNNVPACAVCGKNVQHGGGFARVQRGNTMIELCCPLCLEFFQKDPEPFLKRLQRIDYFRELSRLQEPDVEA